MTLGAGVVSTVFCGGWFRTVVQAAHFGTMHPIKECSRSILISPYLFLHRKQLLGLTDFSER
jgi:hypothetical protein